MWTKKAGIIHTDEEAESYVHNDKEQVELVE